VDADVSEEHCASIFRVEMNRFRNRQVIRSWDPKGEGKDRNQSKSIRRNGQKRALTMATVVYHHRWKME
jgi:hypothetical protein